RAPRVGRRVRGGAHRVLPVRPVAIFDQHGDWRAQRLAGADAGDDIGAIRFDRHAAAAPVAALTSPEIAGDALDVNAQSRRQTLADRFLLHDEESVDLATGEVVHLSISAPPSRADAQARGALCDRLAGLRHPLLVPLVDYGLCRGGWFEAHAIMPPLRISAAD